MSETRTMICNGVKDDGSCVNCACGYPHEEVAACGTAMTCGESPTGEVRCVEYEARKQLQMEALGITEQDVAESIYPLPE